PQRFIARKISLRCHEKWSTTLAPPCSRTKDSTREIPGLGDASRTPGRKKQTGGRCRSSRLSAEPRRLTPLSSRPPQTAPAPPSPSLARSQVSLLCAAHPPAGGDGTRAAPGELTAGFFPRA